MTTEQWAYVAGILDGEGCMALYRGRRDYYIVKVVVGSTDPKIIYWLRDTLGMGSICERVPGNPKHATAYIWQVHVRPDIDRLLKGVLPYLITKHHAAERVLKAVEIIDSMKHSPERCALLDPLLGAA